MEKQVEYGKWYPGIIGSMPEDVLGYEKMGAFEITPHVVVPYIWSNGTGHGRHTSICRIRKVGNKTFKWELTTAKPLWWMAIPPYPNENWKNFSHLNSNE